MIASSKSSNLCTKIKVWSWYEIFWLVQTMNTTSITICLGKMNGLNASYLQECYSVFWSKLTLFVSRLPKPNDSNDYCKRLIYLSCNNYLIFLVSLTSFKERGLQLPVTRKRRWAFWLVLLPYHEEIRV